MKSRFSFVFLCLFCLLRCFVFGAVCDHPRCIKVSREEVSDFIERDSVAGVVLSEICSQLDKYVDGGVDYLSSRLYMYWTTKARDVYVSDECFSHVGDVSAEVATVMFSGNRAASTLYARPRIEDRLPYADDVRGVLMHAKLSEGRPLVWVSPSVVGTQIESGNVDIMRQARNAAFMYWLSGDVRYGALSRSVLDVYLRGILARNLPVDLKNGHVRTLVGMTSFEVIHEEIIPLLAETYDFLYEYLVNECPDCISVYESGLKKLSDVQIANGVPHNNWDLIQARFVLSLAAVLESDSVYADGRGREYYMDVVTDGKELRQWGLTTLAGYGFDCTTGIWNESAGYSINVVNDFTDFLYQGYGSELFSTLEGAVRSLPQYCYPSLKVVGFGDTHPSVLPAAQSFGRMFCLSGDSSYLSLLRCFEPETRRVVLDGNGSRDAFRKLFAEDLLVVDSSVAAADVECFVSPVFYSPNVSWLVGRNGMNVERSLMFSLNGSLGNHQHANGISLELYGCGVTMAPDAGIGVNQYSGKDYVEYYSSFIAHNTVCVDGVSSYPIMKSNHGFRLLRAYPDPACADVRNLRSDDYVRGFTFAEVEFLEPETGAVQRRLVGIADVGDGGYYVDVFRSHRSDGMDCFHDYFYHNLGQEFVLYNAFDDVPLDMDETEDLAFAGGYLYGYSYLYDQHKASGEGDIKGCFVITADDSSTVRGMRFWQKGFPGRTVYRCSAPETEGLNRDKTMPYVLKGSPTQTFVARQEGEAWNKPFVSVFEPYWAKEEIIKSVSYPKTDCGEVIRVELEDGCVDVLIVGNSEEGVFDVEGIRGCASVAFVRRNAVGCVVYVYLDDVVWFEADGIVVQSDVSASVTLRRYEEEWMKDCSDGVIIKGLR